MSDFKDDLETRTINRAKKKWLIGVRAGQWVWLSGRAPASYIECLWVQVQQHQNKEKCKTLHCAVSFSPFPINIFAWELFNCTYEKSVEEMENNTILLIIDVLKTSVEGRCPWLTSADSVNL